MYQSFFMNQGGDWVSWLVWIIFFMVFFLFYPRIMLSQIMLKLESSAKRLEGYSSDSKSFIKSEISSRPDKRIKETVDRFFEFFVIEPVNMDPYGIVRKVDHVIRNERERFDYFVEQVAPKLGDEKKANLKMGMAGGIELHMIAKIVRHYVELIKKTKSYQIAMIIQMQLPLIERMAKALYKGTRTLARGEPIGDSIGPWMVSRLIGKEKAKVTEDEVALASRTMEGRKVVLMKADGPGGKVGYPGKAVEKLIKKHKVNRIITIDAAAKLEGEKTGSVAEGVGVAMGGPGVERTYIENAAVKNSIPLDSIIVKMSAEEAIQPLRKSMLAAEKEVMEAVSRSLSRAKKGDHVLLVGVGNTSGVGNNAADAEKTSKWVARYEASLRKKKKK